MQLKPFTKIASISFISFIATVTGYAILNSDSITTIIIADLSFTVLFAILLLTDRIGDTNMPIRVKVILYILLMLSALAIYAISHVILDPLLHALVFTISLIYAGLVVISLVIDVIASVVRPVSRRHKPA